MQYATSLCLNRAEPHTTMQCLAIPSRHPTGLSPRPTMRHTTMLEQDIAPPYPTCALPRVTKRHMTLPLRCYTMLYRTMPPLDTTPPHECHQDSTLQRITTTEHHSTLPNDTNAIQHNAIALP